MRKNSLSIIVLFALLVLALSGCRIATSGGHICEYSSWEIIEEPSCIERGINERYCLVCDKTDRIYIDKIAHTPTQFEGRDATCTEDGQTSGIYCSECMAIIRGIETVKASGHTVVVDPAIEPTETTPGRTEGKHCSDCGEIIVKQTSIYYGGYNDFEKYNDDYAYKALLALDDGQDMASFYMEIDAYASVFHVSLENAKYKKNGENDVYYMAEVCYSDNGITSEQALTAWSAYIKDHPIYYWIANNVTYSSDNLTVMVVPEYISGESREKTNFDIYMRVQEYIEFLDGETDCYDITLGLHDIIIANADYAYESDGVTPSKKTNAHNIIGVLLEGEGVCESYAKTFQLILNYCGIDNVIVTGYSGEPHAWNLVQLDDGRWYWYDLTWDDQPQWTIGVRHNYFCVSNSEFVKWNDGGSSKSTRFLEDHIPDAPNAEGANFTYSLPEASDTPYDCDGLMLRDEVIEKDGLKYVLIAFRGLALVEINIEGKVDIPESIVHELDEYSVICIGKYNTENGMLSSGSIIPYDSIKRDHIDVTEIHIPKTVRFIWDYAFDYCNTIEKFEVDKDNQAFKSLDGVLFTKSLYTLIKYPLAKTGVAYTVPEATVEIAFGAFGDGGNLFCPKYLKKLTIPDNVDVIGAANAGKGFRDAATESPSDVIKLDGYVERLYLMLGLAGVVIK